MAFSAFGLNPEILRGIKDLAFTNPTPIQAEAIPPALLGRDLLACAATGSGKTLAFLIPTVHRLMAKPRTPTQRRTVRALVITPTRELAAQIHQHLLDFAMHTPITGAPVFGGVSMGPQEHAFRAGADILIATPGRLLDHMRHQYADLSQIEILIVDEADRMLDMGFLPDIRRILRVLPAQRQTLFFSATMPGPIRQLTMEMLKNPVTVQIDRQAAPAVGITQAIYPVPQHLKPALLVELLKGEGGAEMDSVICFTRTKHRANRLAEFLRRAQISCAPIHGNRTQAQRTAALSGFRNGEYRVLVATDVAARGIDIQDVSHVINFDCPHIAEDYIHRVGRTGRASATGDAFTFVAPDEENNLRVIERAINKRLPRVNLPDFDYTQAAEKLEIPLAQRLATMRAQKGQRRGAHGQPGGSGHAGQGGHGQGQHQSGGGGGGRGQFDSRSPQKTPPRAFGVMPPTPGDLHRTSSHNPGRRKPHLPGHGGGPRPGKGGFGAGGGRSR